jgi:hypothetical protein
MWYIAQCTFYAFIYIEFMYQFNELNAEHSSLPLLTSTVWYTSARFTELYSKVSIAVAKLYRIRISTVTPECIRFICFWWVIELLKYPYPPCQCCAICACVGQHTRTHTCRCRHLHFRRRNRNTSATNIQADNSTVHDLHEWDDMTVSHMHWLAQVGYQEEMQML